MKSVANPVARVVEVDQKSNKHLKLCCEVEAK